MGRDAGRRPGSSEPSDPENRLDDLRSSDAVRAAFTEPDRHESNEHVALVYETRAEQFATAVPFVRRGLERDEKCFYVVDDNPRADVVDAMRAGGIDVEAARESGALTFLTGETYVHGGTLTPDDQLAALAEMVDATTGEYPAVRIAVEMTCFLEGDLSVDDLCVYEERYNALSVDADAVALCQYNRERFSEEAVAGAVRAHPHLVADGVFGHNVFYTPPSFAAEGEPNPGVERMSAVLADLAEAETALRRRNERLEAFASVVSHDLRNPLNVAQGHLELAREELDELDLDVDGVTERLETVARAHDRTQSRIDDLLALARAGDRVDELGPVALADVTERTWRNVSTGGATLVVETDRVVRADGTRLQQLLENLVRNAVEHSSTNPRSHAPEDENAVTVTVGDLPDGFYVEDDGPGIPEEERERVFESGYSTTEGGTGLGLAIVTEIADAHGWTVTVTESSEGGARFEVTGVETA